jgi:DNA modification methylase
MLNIVYRKISELIPYEKNPRKNKKAIDKVAGSIQEFGFKNPLIIDDKDIVVAGHTRLQAALKLGLDEVPTIQITDLSEEQIKAFRIADNKTQEYAEWDEELLAAELEDLKNSSYNVEFTGFDIEEINSLFDNLGKTTEEVYEDDFDMNEALEAESFCKLGDVWQLGNHRLMCGDSTKLEHVKKLMAGELADMVFTDPPYNVNYEGGTGLKIENDNMEDSAFYSFLLDAYTSMFESLKKGGPIYVCHADSEGRNFRNAFHDAGFLMKQCLVWVKNSMVLGRQDYQWKHEPILYGWKPGASHKWYGGRKKTTVLEYPQELTVKENKDNTLITFRIGLNEVVLKVPSYEVIPSSDNTTTVWRVEKPAKNGIHPTMKPIELCARAIKNSSKYGDIVLDLFGGSGSTLIACEEISRRGYLMEFDHKYASAIIRRWENLTGKKAIKVS